MLSSQEVVLATAMEVSGAAVHVLALRLQESSQTTQFSIDQIPRSSQQVNLRSCISSGGDEDEGVDDQTVKVVDIVDTFRLQEQPPFDKKQFVTFVKRYIKLLTPKLEPEQQELFKKNIEGATKFLLSKLKDFFSFCG